MRWLLAGLLFALAVGLAIGTAAIRAENNLLRHAVELRQRELRDRSVEHQRLVVERLREATPMRLAAAQWAVLRAESGRRGGEL
jgi:uncharacterized membrane-anchored protein YhcB (DUF1043 family)